MVGTGSVTRYILFECYCKHFIWNKVLSPLGYVGYTWLNRGGWPL
jgi:hypothetical protein